MMNHVGLTWFNHPKFGETRQLGGFNEKMEDVCCFDIPKKDGV